MRWICLDEPNTFVLLFSSFASVYVLYSYSCVLCAYDDVCLEGDQFEGGFEAEAEEPLPEIFEQREFVPEGKSCSTP